MNTEDGGDGYHRKGNNMHLKIRMRKEVNSNIIFHSLDCCKNLHLLIFPALLCRTFQVSA